VNPCLEVADGVRTSLVVDGRRSLLITVPIQRLNGHRLRVTGPRSKRKRAVEGSRVVSIAGAESVERDFGHPEDGSIAVYDHIRLIVHLRLLEGVVLLDIRLPDAVACEDYRVDTS